MPGGTRLDFDRIRPTTLRPFGLMWRGPTRAGPGGRAAVRVLAARRRAGAGEPAATTAAPAPYRFDAAPRPTPPPTWRKHLGRRSRSTPPSSERRTVFSTALYHSLIKPCFAPRREPVLADGRTVRVRPLHDVGHLPDPAAADHRAVARAGRRAGQRAAHDLRGGGQPPDRLPDGPGRRPVLPAGQRARAHLPRRPLPARPARASTGTGRSCTCTTTCAARTARTTCCAAWPTRSATPSTSPSATTARRRSPAHVGDRPLADQFDGAGRPLGERLRRRRPGLLIDSTYYEGGRWNYSFRLLHDMRRRIELAGGDDAFVAHARRVLRLRRRPGASRSASGPGVEELAAGYALNRFEGLNNEPDMEAPWAYHYAGRPDRTAEVVHAAVHNQFGTRPRRPAGQRRLRRAELLVRLGLARAVPGRRPEPLPGQRPVVRPSPSSTSARATWRSRPRASSSRAPDGPPQYVQSVALQRRAARPHLAARSTSCTAAAASRRARPRAERLGPRPPPAVGLGDRPAPPVRTTDSRPPSSSPTDPTDRSTA